MILVFKIGVLCEDFPRTKYKMPGVANLNGVDPATNAQGDVTAVTSASDIFVAPVVAALDVNASASITILQKLSVSMDYNDRYDISLNLADSCSLLNCFDISGRGESFDVMAVHATQFKAVMKKILDNAICTSTGTQTASATTDGAVITPADFSAAATGFTVHQTLNNQLLQLFKNIYTDGIANILQSSYTFSTSVDTSGAAADMWAKLDADSQKAAEVIAQQIPLGNWNLYMSPAGSLVTGVSGENPLTSALPMKAGDKLVFLFRTDEEITVERGQNTAGSTLDTAGAVAPGADAATVASVADGAENFLNPYGNTLALSYKYNQRTIAFFVEVGGAALNVGDAFACDAPIDGELFPASKLRGPHAASMSVAFQGQLAVAPVYGQSSAGGEVAAPVIDAAGF